MKKIYFLMVAVAIAFTASAKIDALKERTGVKFAKSAVEMQRAEIKAETATDGLLYERPEGDYQVFSRSGQSLMWDWGELYLYDQDGFNIEVVFAGDDVVYVRNVLTFVNNDAWVKGSINEDGTKITIAAGTPIAFDNWNGAYLYLYPGKIDLEGAGDNALAAVLIDDSVEGISFTIEGNSLVLDNTVEDESGIAAFYGEEFGNEWAGYMDLLTVGTKLDVTLVTPPATAEKIAAQIVYTSRDRSELDLTTLLGTKGEICIDGSDFYVKGFVIGYDMWIKGTIEGDKVTFANAGFVGVKSGYLMYLNGGKHTDVDTDWGFSYSEFEASGEDVTFDFDAETVSLLNASGDILLSTEPNSSMVLYAFIAPEVSKFEDVALTPFTPAFTDVRFNDYDSPTSYGIALRTSAISVDGKLMDADKVAIRITVNGAPYTFTAAEYTCLENDLEELPLNLSTSDFTFYASSNYNSITIFGEEGSITSLTAQLVYYGGDTATVSGIAEWKSDPSGVEENLSEKAADAPVYNLQGVKVDRDNLLPGIYISGGKKFMVTK